MLFKYFKPSLNVLINEGFSAFVFKFKNKVKKKSHLFLTRLASRLKPGEEKLRPTTVRDYLQQANMQARPIPFLKVQDSSLRLNIVTDSIKKQSLFGGVATSLICATLFANKQKIPLRIISRSTASSPKDYEDFLALMKIPKPEKVEFFSDFKSRERLEVSDQDIFLSTSWWSSKAIQSVNQRASFFYLLQEVELFFYPHGDEQWQCRALLDDPNIHYLVNTRILHDYYRVQGYENVISRSAYFEPAFPKHLYESKKDSFEPKQKRTLFFYSRPNNARNLFKTGIEILDEALLTGVLDEKKWDIYFAGAEIPAITFSTGLKPKILGHMSWQSYIDFTKTVDLGLSLMYTPHPSYPPLDIAASGGVVLTNTFPGKERLPYSENILCSPLDKKTMLQAFEKAVSLAESPQRKQNYQNQKIERDWDKTLEPLFQYMAEHI